MCADRAAADSEPGGRALKAKVIGLVVLGATLWAEPPPDEKAWHARWTADEAAAEAWLREPGEERAVPDERLAWAEFLAVRAAEADSRGQFELEFHLAQRALTLAEVLENEHVAARARNGIGLAHWGLGRYPEAVESFSEALKTFTAREEWTWAAGAASNLGAVLHDSGERDLAVEYYQRALDYDRRGESPPSYIAETLGNLAVVWFDLGEVERADELERQALAIRIEAGDTEGQAMSHSNLGDRSLRTGDLARAREHVERAFTLAGMGDNAYLRAGTRMMLAAVRARTYGFDEARELHALALAEFAAIGAVAELASFEGTLGEALAAMPGQEAWALEVLERSVTMLEEQGRRDTLEEKYSLLIELHRRLGQPDEAWAVADKRETHRREWNEERMGRRAQFLNVLFAVDQKDRELARLSVEQARVEAEAARARSLRNAWAGAAAVVLVGGSMLAWLYVAARRANRVIAATNRELAQANSDKDTFMGIATHDLKAPLAVVRFGLGMLRDRWGVKFDDEGRDLLAGSERAAGRSVEMIDAFLDAQTGQVGGERARLRPAELVDRVMADVAPVAAAKGVALASQVSAGEEIISDALRLERVLSNVVHNAVKFSPAGGRVTIDTAVDASGWTLRVRDEGAGFGRSEASGAAIGSSHQIGLRFSAQLMATLGGRLVTGDRSDRSGAEVRLSLPAPGRGVRGEE